MAFIVGIFETADNRRRCTHFLRKFPLTQACLISQIVDELGDFDVDEFLFIGGDAFGIVSYVMYLS